MRGIGQVPRPDISPKRAGLKRLQPDRCAVNVGKILNLADRVLKRLLHRQRVQAIKQDAAGAYRGVVGTFGDHQPLVRRIVVAQFHQGREFIGPEVSRDLHHHRRLRGSFNQGFRIRNRREECQRTKYAKPKNYCKIFHIGVLRIPNHSRRSVEPNDPA